MARRKKQNADSPAGEPVVVSEPLETLKEQYGLKTGTELAQEKLAEYEAQPLVKTAQIRTARSFTGRVASGRGRVITADDSSFAIESDKPLSAGEIALAQRNGFDDFSEKSDGRIMVADKAELRRANGDINHVAYALTGRDAGRGR